MIYSLKHINASFNKNYFCHLYSAINEISSQNNKLFEATNLFSTTLEPLLQMMLYDILGSVSPHTARISNLEPPPVVPDLGK